MSSTYLTFLLSRHGLDVDRLVNFTTNYKNKIYRPDQLKNSITLDYIALISVKDIYVKVERDSCTVEGPVLIVQIYRFDRWISDASLDPNIKNLFTDPVLRLRMDSNPSWSVRKEAIMADPYALRYITSPTLNEKILAVSMSGSLIQYVYKPDEAIQLAAVLNYPESVRFIHNPTELVQTEAVSIDPSVIRFLTDPSEDVQETAVRTDGNAIQYINDPSDMLKWLAVGQNVYTIRHIKVQSPALQLYAFERDTRVGKYIYDPCEELMNDVDFGLMASF